MLAPLLACAEAPDNDRDPIDLSPELREASGLALSARGRVFVHDDETALVHEIALASGRTVRRFAFGDPPAAGDFEGIAVAEGRIWLITSAGRLLAGPEAVESFDPGVGAACEVEGLSLAPEPGALLILCKRVRGAPPGRLRIYRWRIGAGAPAEIWRDTLIGGDLAPSAIEWVPDRRWLVVLSARDRRLLLLGEDGRLLGIDRLSPRRHIQPEGVAVTEAGALIVADEGRRGRPARITVYPPDYLRQVLNRFDSTASALATSSMNEAR